MSPTKQFSDEEIKLLLYLKPYLPPSENALVGQYYFSDHHRLYLLHLSTKIIRTLSPHLGPVSSWPAPNKFPPHARLAIVGSEVLTIRVVVLEGKDYRFSRCFHICKRVFQLQIDRFSELEDALKKLS